MSVLRAAIGWHGQRSAWLRALPVGHAAQQNWAVSSCRREITRDLAVLLGMTFLLASSGCGTWNPWRDKGWFADYDRAERRQQESGRPMLLLYKDPQPQRNKMIEEALGSKLVRSRLTGHLRCMLYREYEPDRRYMGQFSVTRSPALVIVYADGTYHARSGSMTEEDIIALLDRPPDQASRRRDNPFLPHEGDSTTSTR